MNKSIVSKSLSLLVLPLLIGCGGSNGPTKFYYLDSQWHGSDWIAWLGGKGSYSSYGKYVPANKRITVRAHHDEVQIMVNDLQSKYGNNYDFNIRNYLDH